MAAHDGQATVCASSPAAQLDRRAALRAVEPFDARTCGAGAVDVVAQVLEPQLVELDVLADEEHRRRLAVVDRREAVASDLEVDELDSQLVPVLERQLALDAGVRARA